MKESVTSGADDTSNGTSPHSQERRYYGRSFPGLCTVSPDECHHWEEHYYDTITRIAKLVCTYCKLEGQD